MAGASDFEFLAAIDLRRGRVVRLRQGDFDQETTYGSDPVQTAEDLVEKGARWLHVVDLDGAREGRPVQAGTVAAIVEAVEERAHVEVAGGLRTVAAVDAVLGAGAARVVLGTAAVRRPTFARKIIDRVGSDRVVAALDVRDRRVAVAGWTRYAPGRRVDRVLGTLAELGVTTFEVTGIERDGTLSGPDLELLEGLVALGRGRVIAAGGITTLMHLRSVRERGCAGAVVGRAIYEGYLDLGAAMDDVAADGSCTIRSSPA